MLGWPVSGVDCVPTLSRNPRNVCHVQSWYSHQAFLLPVSVNSCWSSHPPQVLWAKIILPCAADEEVRKYSGHCRAKIRPGLCSPAPEAICGVPVCMFRHAANSFELNPCGSSEIAALLSHCTEEETNAQNSWNSVWDIASKGQSYTIISFTRSYEGQP